MGYNSADFIYTVLVMLYVEYDFVLRKENCHADMYAFVNLAIIPLIVLYIRDTRKGEKRTFSVEWLYQYAVAVTFNTLIARAFAVAVKIKISKVVYADRASYTACALLAAVIQPFLWEAGSRILLST